MCNWFLVVKKWALEGRSILFSLFLVWRPVGVEQGTGIYYDKNCFTTDKTNTLLLRGHVSGRSFLDLFQNALQERVQRCRDMGRGWGRSAAGKKNLHAPNILAISLLLQINQRVDARPRWTCRIDFLHLLLKCFLVSPD